MRGWKAFKLLNIRGRRAAAEPHPPARRLLRVVPFRAGQANRPRGASSPSQIRCDVGRNVLIRPRNGSGSRLQRIRSSPNGK